jgi:hypothetical protein
MKIAGGDLINWGTIAPPVVRNLKIVLKIAPARTWN